MAFFNNLATFKIVNNQSFHLCLQILPLGTNSPIFKDLTTEIKVTFPTMCYRKLCIFAIISPIMQQTWRYSMVRAQNDAKNWVREAVKSLKNLSKYPSCRSKFVKIWDT